MCYSSSSTHRRAFTFIEVMVVVVIIGVLAGAVAIKVRDHVDKSKTNRAKSDIATIVTALETYYGEHSAYPTNAEGLGVLGLTSLKDPWGREYQYNHPGAGPSGDSGGYDVMSFGRDGLEGGEGPDGDVTSWNLSD